MLSTEDPMCGTVLEVDLQTETWSNEDSVLNDVKWIYGWPESQLPPQSHSWLLLYESIAISPPLGMGMCPEHVFDDPLPPLPLELPRHPTCA